MKRWHQERALMLRRWREEIYKHEWDFTGGSYGLAVIPPQALDEPCHCYRGPGFLRKRTAHGGCGRCGVCKPHKVCPPSRRHARERAIRQELVDAQLC
ncbi:MAG TPA: hypothetical protein VE596_02405 [Gaiellaceae bacterium]|jgi:hypothetical protein|nr:hypothetical protein [Gaiellaceae bacterium]